MKMLKDSIWANFGSLLAQIISFISIIIVARFIGPDDFGLVSIGLVFLLFGQRILLEGFGYYVVRESIFENIKDAHILSILFGFIISIIFILCSIILYYNNEDKLSFIVATLSIIPVIEGFSTVKMALMKKDARFKELTIRVLFSNTISSFTAIVLAIIGFGYWSLVIQQILLSLLNLLFLNKKNKFKLNKKIEIKNLLKILCINYKMILNSLIFIAVNRMDVMFLSYYGTAYNVGIYSIAKRLIRTIPDVFVTGSNAVLMTYLNKHSSNSGQILVDKIKYLTLIVYPLLMAIYLYAEQIMILLFGKEWINSVSTLKILCVMCGIQIIYSVIITFLISKNKSNIVLFSNVMQLIFITIILFSIDKVNPDSVAYTFSVSILLSLFFVLYFCFREKYFKVIHVFLAFIYSLLIPLFIFFIFWGYLNLFDFVYINLIFNMLVYILICYFLIILMDGNIRKLIVDFLKKRCK